MFKSTLSWQQIGFFNIRYESDATEHFERYTRYLNTYDKSHKLVTCL
jgi:hypothetical protein